MLNGHEMMYAASLPKVAILLGAFVEAGRGRLPLDAAHLGEITKMIRFSSNEDATRVLDWVGMERLLEILQSPAFALYDAKRKGGLWVGKGYGGEDAYRRDPIRHLSHGATAFQVARFYYLLANDRLVSPRLNAMMKETLSNPGIQHKFVKGLESRPGVGSIASRAPGRISMPTARWSSTADTSSSSSASRITARRRLAGATRRAAARSRRSPGASAAADACSARAVNLSRSAAAGALPAPGARRPSSCAGCS